MTRTLTESYAAAGEAIGQVEAAANQYWMATVFKIILHLARTNEEFTSDDVMFAIEGLPVQTRDPRALGPLMARAKREGVIVWSERWAPSKRRHVAPIRIWTSCLFGQYFLEEDNDTGRQSQDTGEQDFSYTY